MVSGTCLQGLVHMNDTLLLGPTSLGEFLPVAVRGIHRKRMPVKEVRGGQTASFALKKVRRGEGSGCWEIAEGSRCEVLDGGTSFCTAIGLEYRQFDVRALC